MPGRIKFRGLLESVEGGERWEDNIIKLDDDHELHQNEKILDMPKTHFKATESIQPKMLSGR